MVRQLVDRRTQTVGGHETERSDNWWTVSTTEPATTWAKGTSGKKVAVFLFPRSLRNSILMPWVPSSQSAKSAPSCRELADGLLAQPVDCNRPQ